MASVDVQSAPFPAPSKSTSGVANNALTNVTCINFSDKILITVSQAGMLSHWVHVPLATAVADLVNPHHFSSAADVDNALLPRTDLTATTIMGGTKREDEIVGQTLATTIASAVSVKRPAEERLLVLGLGLQNASRMGKEGFEDIVGLVLDCL